MNFVYPWWYYFSWWYFIWVILFLSGVIPFSPYFLSLCILIYTIVKIGSEFIHYFFINKKSLKREQYIVIAIWLFLVMFLDIIPFFFLKTDFSPRHIYFTLGIASVYLLLMWYKKVDVFKLYTFMRYKYLTDNYTPLDLLNAHFPIFNLSSK